MKRFLTLIVVFLLAALESNVFAQKNSMDNYKLRKAYEVLKKNNDRDEAIKLLGEQLERTPDNVEAMMLRMRIYRQMDKPGKALTDINHAIKVNKPKVTEIKNSTLYWWKGYVYQDLNDIEKAAVTLKTAYQLA